MANFSAKYSIMTQEMVDSFYIPVEVHPTALGRDKTIDQYSQPAPFRRYPECFLCLVGLSPYYPFDDNSYPAFERPDGTDIGFVGFYKTADPRKVRRRFKGDDQVTLLESTRHCFMPLVIPAVGVSSSVAATKIPPPTEKGQEGVAEENAYLELADPDEGTAMARQSDKEVVTEQPRKIKKKRLIKQSNALVCWPGTSATPSVAPPSQESKGFVDFSAQASLQIRTTMGSSITLSAPVDTVAAITTSTRPTRRDVNPDLAGPSQLEESEGSDDSFYDLATLDPSEAKRWYVPRWNITNDSLLDDGFSCRTRRDRVFSPCLLRCSSIPWTVAIKYLERRIDSEIPLKSQLEQRRTEAARLSVLRTKVSSLSGEKSALTAEVSALKINLTQKDHDISLLDSCATHLESALNDAQMALFLLLQVSSLRAGFKDFKEKMEIQQEEQAQELYNRVAELEAQCLKSSEYQGILGHALGRAIDFGMQEGLEASHEHGVAGRSLFVVYAYNPEVASADYVNAVIDTEDAYFPLVDLLKSKKDAGMDEVLDCFLLDGPLAELPEAASLQPCIEQLSIPIHHAGDKMAVGETSLSFVLMNVHARAEGAKKHVAALRKLMMEIVSASLSSQNWVGEASVSAAPLSVEDYAEE
ncbi:hypothetical protein Tco_0282627, partial [Tanacetum coccineum]